MSCAKHSPTGSPVRVNILRLTQHLDCMESLNRYSLNYCNSYFSQVQGHSLRGTKFAHDFNNTHVFWQLSVEFQDGFILWIVLQDHFIYKNRHSHCNYHLLPFLPFDHHRIVYSSKTFLLLKVKYLFYQMAISNKDVSQLI